MNIIQSTFNHSDTIEQSAQYSGEENRTGVYSYHIDTPIDTGPVARPDANKCEFRIFFLVLGIFILAAFYFIIKAVVRNWKRHNADYLLTWASTHNKHAVCKCMQSGSSKNVKTQVTEERRMSTKVVIEDEEKESERNSGTATTSSGVGTVESSETVVDMASTNPLLDLLSAPSPTELALMPASPTGTLIDGPITKHHRGRGNNRKSSVERASPIRQPRNSNSSPPSPVFPRRRSDSSADNTSDQQSQLADEHYIHLIHRKRGGSVDVGADGQHLSLVHVHSSKPNTDGLTLYLHASEGGRLSLPIDRDWLRQTWVNDDEDTGSLSISLSAPTAPPDDYSNSVEWKNQ